MDWTAALKTLKEWQDLAGAILCALALVSTIRWTLLAERRRRAAEAKAMRVALGAEIRQFGAHALDSHRTMVAMFARSPPGAVITVPTSRIVNLARFPEAIVYPHSAGQLGLFGNYAHSIVFFFGQVVRVREAASLIPEAPVTSRAELVSIAQALLYAAEAAVEVLPAFAVAKWADGDKIFAKRVTVAREAFEAEVALEALEPEVTHVAKA